MALVHYLPVLYVCSVGCIAWNEDDWFVSFDWWVSWSLTAATVKTYCQRLRVSASRDFCELWHSSTLECTQRSWQHRSSDWWTLSSIDSSNEFFFTLQLSVLLNSTVHSVLFWMSICTNNSSLIQFGFVFDTPCFVFCRFCGSATVGKIVAENVS